MDTKRGAAEPLDMRRKRGASVVKKKPSAWAVDRGKGETDPEIPTSAPGARAGVDRASLGKEGCNVAAKQKKEGGHAPAGRTL